MIVTTFFNKEQDLNFVLNFSANIARSGKRVLYIDARFNKKPVKRLSNIYNCFLESKSLDKFIISLEYNLDILYGSSKTADLDFKLFSKLINGNFLSPFFKTLNYDYIFIELSPTLTLLNQNFLHISDKVGFIFDLNKEKNLDFTQKINNFLNDFSLLYNKNLRVNYVFPIYKNKFKKEIYVDLVNFFSSNIIFYPVNLLSDLKEKKIFFKKLSNKFEI